MTLPFWKLSGAGNDFVLVERGRLGRRDAGSLAERLCSRREGVGADGLLILDASARPPRLEYRNADGSRAYCGNGTRCALAWLASRGRPARLQTAAGLVEGETLAWDRRRSRGTLRVGMPPARLIEAGLRLRALGRAFSGALYDTGVPHLVIAGGAELLRYAPALRRHPALGRHGANVDFLRRERGGVGLVTFERGVEGETPACGTGAVAAALASGLASPVKVFTRGGALMRVRFSRSERGWEAALEGPAEIVFQGEVTL